MYIGNPGRSYLQNLQHAGPRREKAVSARRGRRELFCVRGGNAGACRGVRLREDDPWQNGSATDGAGQRPDFFPGRRDHRASGYAPGAQEHADRLSEDFVFEDCGRDERGRIARFCTSWATSEEEVEKLISVIQEL